MAKQISQKEEDSLIERVKHTLFLKGRQSSNTVNDVMRDLSMLTKPYNKVLSKSRQISNIY